MAISIISQPQDLSPAYSQTVLCVDSTNKLLNGFRYVFEIYNHDTSTLLATLKVASEPTNGYGYADISKILSDYLTYNLDVNSTLFEAPKNYIKYRIDVKETYLYSWNFTSITYTSGSGEYLLNGSTPALYNNNDQIQIQITSGTDTWSQGLHTVESSTGNNVLIDGEYGGGASPVTVGGTVYYANKTKFTSAVLGSFTGYAFNGVVSFKELFTYNANTYTIKDNTLSTTKQMLTDLPDNFTVTPDQDLWLNLFRDPTTTTQTIQYRIQNSNGDIFYNAAHLSAYTSLESSVAVGPGNANPLVLSGTLPIVKPDTTYYDVWLAEPVANGGSQLSKKYRINIDQRCKIEDYEILFQDRKGSWLSYAFQLRAQETGTIERKTYNKTLGSIDAVNGFDILRQETGQTIYSVNLQKQLQLNTNWMNDEMSVMFEQLLTSPVTLLKDTDGLYYQVIVQDGGFETLRQKNRILIKKTINVRYANADGINI